MNVKGVTDQMPRPDFPGPANFPGPAKPDWGRPDAMPKPDQPGPKAPKDPPPAKPQR